MFTSYKVLSISKGVSDAVPSVLDAIEGFDLSVYHNPKDCVDALFNRFVAHISQYWRYASNDALSGDLLSKKERVHTDCGVIAIAFLRLVKHVGLCLERRLEILDPVQMGGHKILLINLPFFDSSWNFRVRNPGEDFIAELFSVHYYCQVGGKYYDPTFLISSENKDYLNPIYMKRLREEDSTCYVAIEVPFMRVDSNGEGGYIFSDKPCVIPHGSLCRQEDGY